MTSPVPESISNGMGSANGIKNQRSVATRNENPTYTEGAMVQAAYEFRCFLTHDAVLDFQFVCNNHHVVLSPVLCVPFEDRRPERGVLLFVKIVLSFFILTPSRRWPSGLMATGADTIFICALLISLARVVLSSLCLADSIPCRTQSSWIVHGVRRAILCCLSGLSVFSMFMVLALQDTSEDNTQVWLIAILISWFFIDTGLLLVQFLVKRRLEQQKFAKPFLGAWQKGNRVMPVPLKNKTLSNSRIVAESINSVDPLLLPPKAGGYSARETGGSEMSSSQLAGGSNQEDINAPNGNPVVYASQQNRRMSIKILQDQGVVLPGQPSASGGPMASLAEEGNGKGKGNGGNGGSKGSPSKVSPTSKSEGRAPSGKLLLKGRLSPTNLPGAANQRVIPPGEEGLQSPKFTPLILQTKQPFTEEELMDWSFNVWDFEPVALVAACRVMMEQAGTVKRWSIPKNCLVALLQNIPQHYYENPYHNFRHGVSVMQCVHSSIQTMGGKAHLTELDILGLLVAGLCHDIEHPGVNNKFLMDTHSDLAKLYCNEAVLENFHYAKTVELLKMPEFDILQSLSKEERNETMEIIHYAIMATDMSKHLDFIKEWDGWIADSGKKKAARAVDPPSRKIVAQGLIKCADISNAAKPWPEAKEWNRRIAIEFCEQGDRELELGLKPAAFMSRDSNAASNSLGFIDFVARPLFTTMNTFLPDSKVCMTNLNSNKDRLQEIIAGNNEQEKQPTKRNTDAGSDSPKEVVIAVVRHDSN